MPIAVLISLALVLGTAAIHYEGLHLASRLLLSRGAASRRPKILQAILWIFLIQLIEIGFYSFGYWFADRVADIGAFKGAREMASADYFYFSAEAFSTLGLGDIYPTGSLRLLASVEAIDGLLLIGWSISFTFLIMQRNWFEKEGAGP
jgi:Ion channel